MNKEKLDGSPSLSGAIGDFLHGLRFGCVIGKTGKCIPGNVAYVIFEIQVNG